ncbi:putative clathrin assembly protein At2g01600 isoform X2 [Physcomitrium patens]|uniref:putative clathrin assembly protein At2g01600 isoform X2 n=1 Tax=Physcomitrium patens TaxID=3218 RepID=UPI000D16A892|nr:putative clathrin assembly protein At2g01600 isoform X2 [Physcomitrium patens]|eukprot:XP_024397463.1 putative clathrin assembly protein At2g01600 isoform X2 [Physcomitrella patens]
MAGWLKGRVKVGAILALLKDQTAASLARASGTFPRLQVAILMGTSHNECLPAESYVEEILATGTGSRMQVTYCIQHLRKRLNKTQNWVVAIKCLVILHRCILDGGFLFQDVLSFSSIKEAKQYLQFERIRYSQAPVEREYCLWVGQYASYLDARLRCAHTLKTHLDCRWSVEIIANRVEYMDTSELLHQLEALQNLMHGLFLCQLGGESGEHPVIQGALVLVVMDSYKLHEEIRLRIQEILDRIEILQFAELLHVLHIFKRAISQLQCLETFLASCKEMRLFSDLPCPGKGVVSKLEIQKVTEMIQNLQNNPKAPSNANSVSLGKNKSDGNAALNSLNIGEEPAPHRHSVGGVADLIDLSVDIDVSNLGKGNTVNFPPSTMQDLITF